MEVLVTGGDTDLGRTIAEGFRDGPSEFGVASGDQHLHRHDLLVFNAEPLRVSAIRTRAWHTNRPVPGISARDGVDRR